MSSSKLQYYVSQQLSVHFGQYTIRENMRPNWLNTDNGGNLELDFFIEELNLAIEVQGEQHWMFIPFFHRDKDGYDRRIEYDSCKKDRCVSRGIRLVEVFSESEIDDLIREFLLFSEEAKFELKHIEEKARGIAIQKRQEADKLRRDLKKVNRGMYKILERMNGCKPHELENNENKLTYVTNRRKSILQRLGELGQS